MSSRSILSPGALPSRVLRQSHARRRAPGSRASDAGAAPNRAFSNASVPLRRKAGTTGRAVLAGGAAASLASLCVYTLGHEVLSPIQNDAKEPRKKSPSPTADLHSGSETLGVHLWGNNRLKVVAPDAAASSSSVTLVKKPRYLNALSGQAFRDLALHESYAVAVTAKGDLLQWGSGFSATADTPTPTLRGQDIVQVALTPNKIYARTKAGKVLIVPASLADQTDTSRGQQLPSISVFWRLLGYHGPGAHFVEMTTANQERKDRKIADISAGRSHLLALAEDGRALCAAVDEQSNECGQLGGGRLLLSGITSKQKSADDSAGKAAEPPITSDRDIRFDTALKEIPALRNLNIKQMVAGDRHSLALSTEGRVLAWGNNSLGQLGLGTGYSFPTIPAPTEASIASAYPKSSSVKPQALYAGGDTSYFLVERTDLRPTAGTEYTESGDRRVYQDLLAAGNGMYGAMGNGQWNSSGVPVRVKTVSGLQEYNETEQTVQPIPVHSLSISSTHAAVVLSNAVQDLVSKQAFGNDVFVFGHNDNYQLGTGKRSNLSIPQHLPPLPYPVSAETKAKIESQKQSGNIVHEESVHSGTKSHMPHNRLQLASRKDKLEERIVCGYGTTAVYWHTNA